MSEPTGKWWDRAYRLDLLWSWWQFVWPWLLKAIPPVTLVVSAYLAALEHLKPWQVFLAGVWGLAGGLFVVFGALLVYQRVKQRRTEPALPVDPESREARDRLVVLFRAHAEPAFTEATNLLSSIAGQLERSGNEARSMVSALLMDAREPRQAYAHALRDALNDPSGAKPSKDLQVQFSEFYKNYQWCSRWIYFAGMETSYPSTLHPYKAWRNADAEFLRELKRTIAHDGMGVLRASVQEIGWGESVRNIVTVAEEPPGQLVVVGDTGPLVFVEYAVDFKHHPDQKTRGLVLRNSTDVVALNVMVSSIAAPTGRSATFPVLSHLFKDTPREVIADVEGMGPVFAHNLGEVLHEHYIESRTIHGFNVLFQPIQIPLTITYGDGHGRTYRSNYIIDYVPGHETATARFQKRETVAAQ